MKDEHENHTGVFSSTHEERTEVVNNVAPKWHGYMSGFVWKAFRPRTTLHPLNSNPHYNSLWYRRQNSELFVIEDKPIYWRNCKFFFSMVGFFFLWFTIYIFYNKCHYLVLLESLWSLILDSWVFMCVIRSTGKISIYSAEVTPTHPEPLPPCLGPPQPTRVSTQKSTKFNGNRRKWKKRRDSPPWSVNKKKGIMGKCVICLFLWFIDARAARPRPPPSRGTSVWGPHPQTVTCQIWPIHPPLPKKCPSGKKNAW